MKKKWIIIAILLALVGTAFGSWLISATDTFTVNVVSQDSNPLYFTVDFPDITINTTMTSNFKESNATVYNNNGNIDIMFTVVENKVSTNPSCIDITNDCITLYKFNGNPIGNSDNISIGNGEQYLYSKTDCVQNSCPQEINITVTLTEI